MPQTELPQNETRARLLQVAEELFMTHGYAGVSLRDIAAQMGIKHTLLYYYMPGGKEQLFVEVIRSTMERHQAGMEHAINAADPDIKQQLQAVAHWLLAQQPLNLARMSTSDLAGLSVEHAEALPQLMFDALRSPLQAALEQAQAQGTVDVDDPGLAAILFLALVQTIHIDPAPYIVEAKQSIVAQIIQLWLYGILKR